MNFFGSPDTERLKKSFDQSASLLDYGSPVRAEKLQKIRIVDHESSGEIETCNKAK